MVKIDRKDRKILYYLLNNSRQPLSTLGKNVGLSREVVGYRIKRLEKEGIIVNYPTHLRQGLLELSIARYYITYQFMSPDKKQEIIDYFINNDIVEMLSELEGNYDLQLNVYMGSSQNPGLVKKFLSFYEKTQRKYRPFFDEQIVTVYTGSDFFDLIFLLDDEKLKPTSIPAYDLEIVSYDNLDMDILRKLTKNARIPTVQLAKELNVTVTTVNNRIKRLIDENVIWKFSALIDWSKIGYRQYNIEINLKDFNKKYDIIDYIRNNQHIWWIMHSIGRGVDLDFEFILKDITQLQEIINDLSEKFPESIKNFKYFSTVKIHKWNDIPF